MEDLSKFDDELEALLAASEEDDEGEGDATDQPKPKKTDDDDDENVDDEDADAEEGLDDELRDLLGAAEPSKPDAHRDESISRSRTAERAGVIPQAQNDAETNDVLQKIATGTDPVSKVMQGIIRHSYVTQKRLDDFIELQEVPARIRPLVRAEYEKGDYRTVAAARRAVVGMLVSGELKAPGKKKTVGKKPVAPRRELPETALRDGGGRKPRVSLSTITEMDEDRFYKLMEGPATRLKQVLYQKWRNGGLELKKKNNR